MKKCKLYLNDYNRIVHCLSMRLINNGKVAICTNITDDYCQYRGKDISEDKRFKSPHSSKDRATDF